jgi:hypothetical protein
MGHYGGGMIAVKDFLHADVDACANGNLKNL